MNDDTISRSDPLQEDERDRELRYLRRRNDELAAKLLALDSKAIGVRHELEHKRRGFSLMASLAVALERGGDYTSMFVAVSRRINAALNMQRTAVLMPEENNRFKAVVLQGYPPEEEARIAARRIVVEETLLDAREMTLITGVAPPERLASLREALALPYCIISPVVLNNEIAAILITGRMIEQQPFFSRLSPHDVETVQSVSAYLAAMISERRLIEAEERTQIMLDAMPLCCMFWDEGFKNIDCNAETLRLFNVSSKQEFLDRFFEFSPTYQPNGLLSADLIQQGIQKAFSEGSSRFEWLHQKLDGEPIPMEVSLVRIDRRNKHIVVAYMRDLREFKSMLAEIRKGEQNLRTARDLAEKNAKAKSEFLANVSHEIRTPMNAIVSMTHFLDNANLTEKQRAHVENAKKSSQFLLRVIEDMLDFSKLDAGRMEMQSVAFSVRELAAKVRAAAVSQAAAKHLAFRDMVDGDVPDVLLGDPSHLEQILLNLVSNAVKFTLKGEVSLRVSLHRSANMPEPRRVEVLFAVRDTGIGISEEQMRELFMPFTQADASFTRHYGGTGLGLAICRKLADLMQGDLWCESRPDAGSTFSLTVPFVVQAHASQEVANLRESAPRQENIGKYGQAEAGTEDSPADDFSDLCGLRVLLTEDNAVNQMIASELLLEKGVVVDVAGTGLEALAALERKEYDLVLMDIQMPEMDGLTATRRIRANPAYGELPVIAMTAHALAEDRALSREAGMNEHLTKPIDPNLLYAALRQWSRRNG
ncbi:MAG: response regulator [Desulfovibrio sp.]|jgi:signal transduction histidine kinase/CheY-like chemotaxis protein|nr:response regulator [Desulfovibrio sp.]